MIQAQSGKEIGTTARPLRASAGRTRAELGIIMDQP
jgi:hypothetical protein